MRQSGRFGVIGCVVGTVLGYVLALEGFANEATNAAVTKLLQRKCKPSIQKQI